MDDENPPTDEADLGSPWDGFFLSLFVPGFGYFRAGRPIWGTVWFLGIHLSVAIAIILLITQNVPVQLSFAVALVPLWLMLVKNCQPGRMSPKLTLLFVALLLSAIPITLIYRQFVARVFINTSFMEPAIMSARDGSTPDLVAANQLSYSFKKPARGDIIAFNMSHIATQASSYIGASHTSGGEKEINVRRVIGLPGERVQIRNGSIFVNGKRLGEADGIPNVEYEAPFGTPIFRGVKKLGDDFVIEANEYFVLADDPTTSYDSRAWGNVPAENILGKITKIYWPPSRWGTPQ